MRTRNTVPDDMPIESDMAAITLAAIRRAPHAHDDIRAMVGRRQRRMLPRPGGAAREKIVEMDDPDNPWDAIEMRLPQQNHGGSITTVHRTRGDLALHAGHILRTPFAALPESVLVAAPGMAVGDLVELSDTGFASIARTPIRTIMPAQLDTVLLFYLDLPVVRPRIRDLAMPGTPPQPD